MMIENNSHYSKPKAIFLLFRPARTMMVAMMTGVAAFTAGADLVRSLWMALAGWCLGVGGFSLDFYADRELDMSGPRGAIRYNPLANSSLSPTTGLVFSLTFILVSLILTWQTTPWALIPWGVIFLILFGLTLHLFETPLTRASTLGLLQALYVLMGATADSLSLGIMLLACALFFAMSGGRGMTDIRDFPQDQATPVQTLPKRYAVSCDELPKNKLDSITLPLFSVNPVT